jgi:predicted small secreted protein
LFRVLKFFFGFHIKSFPQIFINIKKLIKILQNIKQNFAQKFSIKSFKSLENFPENKDGKERYVYEMI